MKKNILNDKTIKNLFICMWFVAIMFSLIIPSSSALSEWQYNTSQFNWYRSDGNYTIVMFNASATYSWQVPLNVYSIDYLIIGGGGGGGFQYGGGGGAGGYRNSALNQTTGGGNVNETPLITIPLSSLTVTVGTGGIGGTSISDATNGGSSVFETITAYGGGAGGKILNNGNIGGCGGGGAGHSSLLTIGGNTTIPIRGYNGGGNGGFITAGYPAGGGGGTCSIGNNATSNNNAGNGGNGCLSGITGESIYRGGGGGGGIYNPSYISGVGGNGGGGAGSNSTVAGVNGITNTGGGGGGGSNGGGVGANGGNGGSGIVVLRYMPITTITPSGNTTGTTINVYVNTSLNNPNQESFFGFINQYIFIIITLIILVIAVFTEPFIGFVGFITAFIGLTTTINFSFELGTVFVILMIASFFIGVKGED